MKFSRAVCLDVCEKPTMMGNLLCSTDDVKGAVFFVPVPDEVCGGREKTVEEGQLSGDNLVIFRRTGGVSRKDFLLPERSLWAEGGARAFHVTPASWS